MNTYNVYVCVEKGLPPCLFLHPTDDQTIDRPRFEQTCKPCTKATNGKHLGSLSHQLQRNHFQPKCPQRNVIGERNKPFLF